MIGVGIIGLFKPEIAEIAKTQVLKFVESGSLVNSLNEKKRLTQNQTPEENENSSKQAVKYQPNTSEDNSSSLGSAFGSENSMVGRYARKLKLNTQLKAYGLSKDGFKGIDYIKIEGQTALVGFKFHSDKFDRNIVIEIKMEDAGGYWRVTELSNLNDLINTYLETRNQLESALPAGSPLMSGPANICFRLS